MAANPELFDLRHTVTRDANNYHSELTHIAYAGYVEGAMSLADEMIANGVFDEESVLISTITSIDTFVHNWADTLRSTPISYWRMIQFASMGHTYTVGNFTCRLDLYEVDDDVNERIDRMMYLKVKQGDCCARIYPEDSGKNPSKIIRDGKLVTGRYRFNETDGENDTE